MPNDLIPVSHSGRVRHSEGSPEYSYPFAIIIIIIIIIKHI